MAGKILAGCFLPPAVSAAALASLLILAISALFRLNVNNDPETYLPPNSPAVVAERELRETFPTDRVLVALFVGDVYSTPFLNGLADVTEQLEANRLVERTLSVLTVDHIAGSEDGFSVGPLLDRRDLSSLEATERRAKVLSDRFAPGMLASVDGTALALVIRPRELEQSTQSVSLESTLRQAVRAAGIEPQLAAVGGDIALQAAQFRSMIRDTIIFLPTVFLIGMGLIWLMFHRWLAVVAGAVVMGVVTATTVALFVIFAQPYTLVTSMMPPLMASLSASLLIHFFNSLAIADAHGLDGPTRVVWACRNIERPARFTAVTTAAGLLSLSLTPIPPIRAFGLAAACGALMTYVVCIILLPPIFARWDRNPWVKRGTGLQWVNTAVIVMAAVGTRHPRKVVAVTVLGMIAVVPAVASVRAETNLLTFFSYNDPISRSTRLIEEKLTGVTTLEISLDGGARDALTDPRRLQQMRELEQRLTALPQVDQALSMPQVLEEMNWALNGEDESYRRVPDTHALVSQYLLLYDGRDLFDLVDRDFRKTRIALSVNVHGSREIQSLITNITEVLETASLDGMTWAIAGNGLLFAEQDSLLVTGQIRSLWGAVALVSSLLFFLWRSAAATILTMVPNIMPVLVMFGVMGATGVPLDMATVLIASLVIGIAVDDTIYLFHNYRSARRSGADTPRALRTAYFDAGRAIIATTIILCAQFSILTLSHFRPTAEFGLFTTIGLLAALALDLLLLPALLSLRHEWRNSAVARGF